MKMKPPSLIQAMFALYLTTSGIASAGIEQPLPHATPLTPFALSVDGWQLDGETDRISWNLNVDPATAAGPSELVLALETAVSVMPEVSRLAIQVNGRDIGLIQLGGSPRPVTIPLPAGTLAGGWNRIVLSASQRHRVDCSLAGTYELWTRIDPARSGFRAMTSSLPGSGIGLLASASADSSGAMRIRLRNTAADPDVVSAGFTAVGLVARLTASQHPVVDVNNAPGIGAGIDIAIGGRAELAALGLAEATIAAAATMPQVLAAGPAGRPTLVILSGSRGYADALNSLAKLVADHVAPVASPLITGTETQTVSFKDAGIGSNQFTGRAWKEQLNVSLPADALIADYDSVTMTLDAGYAPGLSADNRLSVFVDDRLAATVKLGNSAGEFLQNRQIEVPLSAFHPGSNQIRLEAQVASPDDSTCTPSVQIDGVPRFLALDTTRFTFPRLARMAHLPDLGATLALGKSGAGEGAVVPIALARSDATTIGAAATLFAKMAAAADTMTAAQVVDLASLPMQGDYLLVGTAGDIPNGLISAVGVDPLTLRQALTAPIAMISDREPATTSALSGSTLSLVMPAAAAEENLRDAWRSRLKVDDSWHSQLSNGLNDLFASIGSLIGFATPDELISIDPATRLVLAQANTGGRLVTLVAAASASDLTSGINEITSPQAWRKISGRATILDSRTGEIKSQQANHADFVPTGPLEFGNLRLVAAAWLSLNQVAYGLLLVAAAVAFGLVTWFRVRRAGVRTAA